MLRQEFPLCHSHTKKTPVIISVFYFRPSKKPLTTLEVYKEMIAQRPAQGFQIIILPKTATPTAVTAFNSSPFQTTGVLARSRSKKEPLVSSISYMALVVKVFETRASSIHACTRDLL